MTFSTQPLVREPVPVATGASINVVSTRVTWYGSSNCSTVTSLYGTATAPSRSARRSCRVAFGSAQEQRHRRDVVAVATRSVCASDARPTRRPRRRRRSRSASRRPERARPSRCSACSAAPWTVPPPALMRREHVLDRSTRRRLRLEHRAHRVEASRCAPCRAGSPRGSRASASFDLSIAPVIEPDLSTRNITLQRRRRRRLGDRLASPRCPPRRRACPSAPCSRTFFAMLSPR